MVGKIYLESMLYEIGFGDATKMVGFALDGTISILGTRTFLDIHIQFISIVWRRC